jgi:peroxin-5
MIKQKQSFGAPLIALLLLLAATMACSNTASNGDAHASQGITAYEAGRYDEAIEELQQAIEMGVTEYEIEEIYTILGNTFDNLDLYDEAIDAHEKALELNPDYYKAWVNLGITYRHIGDLDRAEESYNKALKSNPNMPNYMRVLGR